MTRAASELRAAQAWWASALELARDKIAARLPAGANVDRWIGGLQNALSANPKLYRCDRAKLFAAAFEVAHCGLQLGAALGQAYVIPYKNTPTVVIGYKGLIALAMRSGAVLGLSAEVVHEADRFEYEAGMSPKLIHVPTMAKDRGDPIAVYCSIEGKGGARTARVVPWHEIEAMRSKYGSRSPAWRDHTREMAIKTAIKKTLKWLPLTSDLARVIQLDGQAEIGEAQALPDRGSAELTADRPAAIEAEAEVEVMVPAEHPFSPDFDPTVESGGAQ